MRMQESRRVLAVAGPALVAGLVLAACGSSDSGAPSVSTIELSEGSTSYQTLPPATTTTVPGEGEGFASPSQEYVVQPGDYPIKVANDFGVPLEDLVNFNGWASEAEFPFPGETILIPPGGRTVGGASDSADSADGATDGSEDTAGEGTDEGESAGEAIEPPSGDACQPGSYTIAEGDIPIRVAEKFDVTVDELNEANVATDGYSAFYVGLEIVIPPASDCDE
jgi:LysM repeat protein